MLRKSLQKEISSFPFFKLEKLRLLIVGGGYVGLEKLEAVVGNSPATTIKLVATQISHEIKELVACINIFWNILNASHQPFDRHIR